MGRTSIASVLPTLTYTGKNNVRTTKACDVLKPVNVNVNKNIAYEDIECSVKWSDMKGGATLGFDVKNYWDGPSKVVADKFFVYPAVTVTSSTTETTTWYTTLSPEPATTTTEYVATETLTDTLQVDPTPAATTTISPYKTTETVTSTISPDPYGTTTM